MSDKILGHFFAVTLTSVYRVVVEGEREAPYLLKIARRAASRKQVGSAISNGTMVSVGKQLIMFVPEGAGGAHTTVQREINNVNTRYWGGNTSSVVALFLLENEALACNRADNPVALDPRWLKQTKEVLWAIGDSHPRCSITNAPVLRLMAEEEWMPV